MISSRNDLEKALIKFPLSGGGGGGPNPNRPVRSLQLLIGLQTSHYRVHETFDQRYETRRWPRSG